MRLIDSHAHLDDHRFKDLDAVIARARKAGLAAIVTIGASLDSSRAAVALAEAHDFVYATVGVHPHDAKSVTPTALKELRELACHPKVVALGEIGLDYYRDLSPRAVQRRAFADQLALAAELELPVVIHSRDAHDDVMAILRDWADAPPSVPPASGGDVPKGQGRIGVIHSYSDGPERLDEVLALGLAVGISGPVTYPKADRLREVAATVPLDRLLIETDCPYLTPQQHRGQRNEPAYVRHVAQEVAHARGVTERKVALATTENVCRLFNIPQTEKHS